MNREIYESGSAGHTGNSPTAHDGAWILVQPMTSA
jgi:hypothetical protein